MSLPSTTAMSCVQWPNYRLADKMWQKRAPSEGWLGSVLEIRIKLPLLQKSQVDGFWYLRMKPPEHHLAEHFPTAAGPRHTQHCWRGCISQLAWKQLLARLVWISLVWWLDSMFHAFPKQYSIVASLKYVHRQHGFLFKHFKGTDKTA